MRLAYLLDRFGIEAISDRPLRGGDILAILHTERIRNALEARNKAESVLVWEAQNEEDAGLLERLERDE